MCYVTILPVRRFIISLTFFPFPIASFPKSMAWAVLLNHSSLSHHRLWDIGQPVTPLVETIAHHSEFTFGLDFSPLAPGKVSHLPFSLSQPHTQSTEKQSGNGNRFTWLPTSHILVRLHHCTFIMSMWLPTNHILVRLQCHCISY